MSERGWILIVDDDDDTREMVTLLLGIEGYRVIGAGDGVAALEEIRGRGRPALILLDLRMPRMDGHDFARAIRQDPALAGIPIVVFTGDAATSGVDEVTAVEWMVKPIDLSKLIDVVARVIPP